MSNINGAIHILLSFDDNYVVQATVTMHSIIANNMNEKLVFHIFHNNVSKEKIERITQWIQEKQSTIFFYDISENDCQIFYHLIHNNDHVTVGTFFRLFSAKLLSPDINKILYVDCDTINLAPLELLWTIDISGYALAATVGSCNSARKKKIGLLMGDLYFQAGVLLINLDYWRKNNVTDILLEYVKNTDYLSRWDQDILNSVFKWRWKRLPLKFNLPNGVLQDDPDFRISKTSFARQFSIPEREEAIKAPVILHFTGCNEYKPWVKGIRLINREKYLKYCGEIPFPHKMTAMPLAFPVRHFMLDVMKTIKLRYSQLRKLVLHLQKKIFRNVSPSYRAQLSILEKLNEITAMQTPNSLLMRNIQKRLNAALLHQTVFPKYKNIYQGQDVVLVGTGATSQYYRPLEKAVHIGVNRAFMIPDLKLDYLFVADYAAHIGGPACAVEYLKRLEEYTHEEIKIFYGILDDDMKHEWIIPESLALKHNAERYYAMSSWAYRPFKGVLQLESEMLSDNGSISFHAFEFALFTNPKRIFLVGCDTALTGYFDNQSQPYNYDHTHILEGWHRMKLFAKTYYPDTEIISINPVGLKGVFTDMFTDNYANAE